MDKKNIIRGLFLALGFVALQSCDKDYTETGNDIIGGGDYDVQSYVVKDLKAYNQAYGPVETSRLPEVSLGSIKNGVFGTTSNSIALNFADNISSFGELNETAVLDSVYLYIPFYNVELEKKEENISTYKLNSTYGSGSFDLKVYQNGYFLSNDNPVEGGSNKYYNNSIANFESNKASILLNDSPNSTQNTNVIFNNKGINIYKKGENGETTADLKSTLAPGFWIDLNKEYFQKFFVENRTKLASTDYFQDIFKGLFLQASPNSSKGAIGLINPAQGYLRATYSQDQKSKDADGKEVTTKVRGEIKLSLLSFAVSGDSNLANSSNILVNLMNTNEDDVYKQMIANPNKTNGDDQLYLKGAEGSVAVIDLFQSNDFEELKKLRDQKVLINDAFLTVHLDQEAMQDVIAPERLYLYNFDDGTNIADFLNDSGTTKPIFGGNLIPGDDKGKQDKYSYTFRVKDLIQNLIKGKTIKSPKLALTVSNSYTNTIKQTNFKTLQTPITNQPTDVKTMSSVSITSPLGAVIYGNTEAAGKKRMKLEIFYTTKN